MVEQQGKMVAGQKMTVNQSLKQLRIEKLFTLYLIVFEAKSSLYFV